MLTHDNLKTEQNRIPYNSEDRHFRNQTTLAPFFCTKFTFDNLNSACLEYFLFYPNNRLAHLQILSYRDLNVVAPIFSLD